ncbi:type II-A CRISPR-associated protein Csn2 [Lactococcus piscium]|uniref:type II-A CRISPR-associated protein Csn2 n=1 Tax=Pseudolactococcus carnosus TaxID=2749961 RepID=UPI0015DCBE47|nr:type II-A CRISPR-associated protein Csn2 [Lactococcus carnosus]MCJ1974421.1 type II-A CRISPR-associated protein Csn2 [Lactococcus carnosus]MCJ1984762.1 type II-A CRISPR-associated protein Csn2 [Lactococcus carnosus]MCJ1987284.1 type II-A CRISPR-associated protein Csn2 [Lactococcus carnosus]MCJ2000106.1 type II-A CRISPR-associated protein Csn2 [Lactococcus carnosus]MCJ2004011.1 type II-A CRISPR-associated protein Csn2 [Lactococcus carnosus]
MNLNFSQLDEPIPIGSSTMVVVEDVRIFATIVRDLYNFDENSDLKLYDQQFKSLKASDLLVITDILGFDVNAKPVLKLIYQDLEIQLNEKPEVKSMIDKLTATISELIGYELLDHELDLEQDEITVQELFKALGVQIETSSDTIFEKVFEILQIFKYLSKKKMLVFVNVASYLTLEELQSIQEFSEFQDLKIIFLERYKTSGFPQYILDTDYFLCAENMV